jgi:hypothetical protein
MLSYSKMPDGLRLSLLPQPILSDSLSLHYPSACWTFSDETLSTSRFGSTRLCRRHPTSSAFLRHFLFSPPVIVKFPAVDVELPTPGRKN